MDYYTWNRELVRYFFNPANAGQRVCLACDDDVLNEIGRHHGLESGRRRFVETVAVTEPGRGDIADRASRELALWRAGGGGPCPPYVASLCLMALAADLEQDPTPNSFYPKLRALIKRDVPRFHLLDSVWEDLEHWANYDNSGKLGLFYAQRLYNYTHVGFPLAQVLIPRAVQKNLSQFFARHGYDPEHPPSSRRVKYDLQNDSWQLGGRARRVIEGKTKAYREMQDVLVSQLLDALSDWDGSIPDGSGSGRGPTSESAMAYLAICLQLDEGAGTAKVRLRCRGERAVTGPFTILLSECRFYAEPYYAGWSTVLKDDEGTPAGLSVLDLVRGVRTGYRAHGRSVTVVWGRGEVRVFGASDELPGYVEVDQVVPGREYLVLTRSSNVEGLVRWASASCTAHEVLPIAEGLDGFALLRVYDIYGGDQLEKRHPILKPDTSVKLELSGGLAISRRKRHYWHAFPPRVTVYTPVPSNVGSSRVDLQACKLEYSIVSPK